jgi:hypothetical protein
MKGKARLNSKERGYLRVIGQEALELRYDYRRRLRNATLALALSDPDWMIWLEKNIPPHEIGRQHLQLVESRARAIVLKHYGLLNMRNEVGWLLFRQDWAFSDSGALSPG